MSPRIVLILIFAIFLIVEIHTTFAADDRSQKTSLKVEHSLDGKTWKIRGQISFRASAAFMRADDSHSQKSASIDQAELSQEDMNSLMKLSKEGGYYRIRVQTSSNDASEHVLASIPACNLLSSNLVDQITLNLQLNKPIGISIHSKDSKCSESVQAQTRAFNTKIEIQFGEDSPKPIIDPSSYQKPAETSPQTEKNPESQPVEEEKGFFAKYVRKLSSSIIASIIAQNPTNVHSRNIKVALPITSSNSHYH